MIGSVMGLVKSCTTFGQFSTAGNYCLGLDGFFFFNNGTFSDVIFLDFLMSLILEFSFIALKVIPIEYYVY